MSLTVSFARGDNEQSTRLTKSISYCYNRSQLSPCVHISSCSLLMVAAPSLKHFSKHSSRVRAQFGPRVIGDLGSSAVVEAFAASSTCGAIAFHFVSCNNDPFASVEIGLRVVDSRYLTLVVVDHDDTFVLLCFFTSHSSFLTCITCQIVHGGYLLFCRSAKSRIQRNP